MLEKKQQISTSSVSGSSGLLFASALALGLLVGCGGETESSAPAAEPAADATVTAAAEAEVTEPQAAESQAAEADAEPEPEVEAEPEAETPEPAAKEEAPLDAAAGAKRYEASCKLCHDSGMLSSPKIGDKAAWAPRIAKGKETLYKHSAEGFNSMPPQAVGDISEAEVHAAVDYMIEQSS